MATQCYKDTEYSVQTLHVRFSGDVYPCLFCSFDKKK